VQSSGLERSLIELVKTRGLADSMAVPSCINMHTQDARKHGETERRLYLLNAWREAPVYTDRERAALAWTEAVTLISETHRARRRLQRGPRAVLGSRDRPPHDADRKPSTPGTGSRSRPRVPSVKAKAAA